jgi:NDP-sugar pyrophosphorylase family protein
MALIAGRPFLEYLLFQLKRHSITRVTLCVGHRSDLVRDYFGPGDRWGLQLTYSVEQDLLGTAGALKLAEGLLKDADFLAMNGDSLFDAPLSDLITFHRRQNAVATLALSHTDHPERFGTVKVDEEGRVLRFLEKGEDRASGLINGGIYVFSRQILEEIPAGRAVSLEREIFPSLVGRGLYGLAFPGYFLDIGVPEALSRAQTDAERLREVAGLAHETRT